MTSQLQKMRQPAAMKKTPGIAPELDTLEPLPREKRRTLACFALAGLECCASFYLSPLRSVTGLTMTMAIFGGRMLLNQFIYRTRETSDPDIQEKLTYLRKENEKLCARMGLRRPPDIRIHPKRTATLRMFHKDIIAFSSDYLQYKTKKELRAILGHELAHVKLRHSPQNIALLFLFSPTFYTSFLLGFLPAFGTLMYHSRQNEFQADRVGAVLTRDPETAAADFSGAKSRTKRYGKTWKRYSISKKTWAYLRLPVRFLRYTLFQRHPDHEQRYERLRKIKAPPQRYASDSTKSRFLRLLV